MINRLAFKMSDIVDIEKRKREWFVVRNEEVI
jgi:hypothetical protein